MENSIYGKMPWNIVKYIWKLTNTYFLLKKNTFQYVRSSADELLN